MSFGANGVSSNLSAKSLRMAGSRALPFLLPRPSLNIPCYVCRSCTSIVGWGHHVLLEDVLAVIPDAFLLSDIESTRVIVEDMPFLRGLHLLRTLFCSNCGNLIGWKIAVASGPLSPIFSEGRYIFFARGILFWNTRGLEDPVWRPSNIRR